MCPPARAGRGASRRIGGSRRCCGTPTRCGERSTGGAGPGVHLSTACSTLHVELAPINARRSWRSAHGPACWAAPPAWGPDVGEVLRMLPACCIDRGSWLSVLHKA